MNLRGTMGNVKQTFLTLQISGSQIFVCTKPLGACLKCKFLATTRSSSDLVALGWSLSVCIFYQPLPKLNWAKRSLHHTLNVMIGWMTEWNGCAGDSLSFSFVEHLIKAFWFYFTSFKQRRDDHLFRGMY